MLRIENVMTEPRNPMPQQAGSACAVQTIRVASRDAFGISMKIDGIA